MREGRTEIDSMLEVLRLTLGANPYLPTGYMVSTWWVLKQNTQHGPTGTILITFWLLLQFTPNSPTQIPTRYMLSIFKKYPAQNPLRVVLIYPLGSFWLILHFAHNSLTQIPTGHMLSIFTKYPPRYPPITGLGTFKKYPPRTQWVNFGQITSETLDSFHNSHKKVPSGYFVKEPLGFFQKWPRNVLIMCLSHSFWVFRGFI